MGDSTAVARVHSETAAADLSGVHSVLFLNGGGSLNTDELVVVMPTRIRMDSRVVLAHCTITWLSNSAFVLLLLAKVLCRVQTQACGSSMLADRAAGLELFALTRRLFFEFIGCFQ